jgi:hypothetical protein
MECRDEDELSRGVARTLGSVSADSAHGAIVVDLSIDVSSVHYCLAVLSVNRPPSQ